MFKQDLEGEEIAIKLYKELIAIAEKLGGYGIRRSLEDIFDPRGGAHKRFAKFSWKIGLI